MANLDEARIEEEDIGVMESDPFCSAFPLNCSSRAARVTVFVDVNSEFYMSVLILYLGSDVGVKPTHRHNTEGIRHPMT